MKKKQQIKMDDEYVSFSHFATHVLGQQCQYASRYVRGKHGSANLGIGLRFKNLDTDSYHDIKIHKDDMKIFEERYRKHMKELLE
jgi:hypothetical protein